MSARRVLRVRRVRSDDSGFTLVELLVSMVIVSLILSSISIALYLALHNIDATADALTTSRYAQSLGVWLPSDVQTVGVGGIDTNAGTGSGCSGASPGVNLVRFTPSAGTTVVSYRIVPAGTAWQLVRYDCTLGGPPTTHVVVDGMPTATSATVAVASSGNPPVTTVTVTASSQAGRSAPYTFSITGSALTPASGPCAVVAAPSISIVVDGTGHLPSPADVTVLTDGACAGLALRLTPSSSPATVPLTGGPSAWSVSLATTLPWTTGVKTVTITGAGAPAAFSVRVTQASTTSLTASAEPAPYGDPLTLTARVAGASGTATGTMTFYDGDTILSSPQTLSGSAASFTTTTLAMGAHTFIAVYSGGATYDTSTSAPLSGVVKQRPRIALTSSLDPSTSGVSVRFSVAVAGDFGVPTGTVTFKDGGTVIGTGGLDGAGNAFIDVSTLAIGTHTITVDYGGDGTYLPGTSNTVTQTVNRRPSTTTISSATPNPSLVGQPVRYTITVSGGGPSPTGVVEVWDGPQSIRAGTLDATGTVRIFVPRGFTTPGIHTMVAKYLGDAQYQPSDSAPFDQVVHVATSVTLVSSDNPSLLGQNVTLTADVTPNPTSSSDSISFFDGGTLLGTAPVDDVTGMASFDVDTLTAGSHAITAQYSGDAIYAPSTSPVLDQLVAPCTVITHGVTAPDPIPRSSGQTSATVTFAVVTSPGCGAMTLTLDDPDPTVTVQSAGPTTWTWSMPSGSNLGGGTLTITVRNNGVVLDTWTTDVQ